MAVERRVSIRTFLRRVAEAMPAWLASFGPRSRFSAERFFQSRVVYYPGSGTDGHPVKMFGSSHSAHGFIYVDYGIEPRTIEQRLNDPDAGFAGYRSGPRVAVRGRDLFTGWYEPHAFPGEIPPATRLEADDDECGFLQILDRRDDVTDDHGPRRLAVLFLFTDGIAAYDALFCQVADRPGPFAALLHDHGFGGNYDRFGDGGLLHRIAARARVFPDYLLVAHNTTPWQGYTACEGVDGDVGGSAAAVRRLWQR